MLQATIRLPAFEGDDHGLMLWGLATLGAPLDRTWLQVRCNVVICAIPQNIMYQ
jgi:hypothetical protein